MSDQNTGNNSLVFIFHGYAMNPKKYLSLKRFIQKTIPNSRVFLPRLPLRLFSTVNLNAVVNTQLLNIDHEWSLLSEEQKLNTKIIIVGHSTGALIARKVYVSACGENEDAPIESQIVAKDPRNWAGNVERIILLAGINKGWTLNEHIPLGKLLIFKLLILVGAFMSRLGYVPTAFKTRRGSRFITELRLQSISMQRHSSEKNLGNALVVQLLGSIDDIVSPEDNIDLLTGSKFVYLDIPFSDHISVINMSGEFGTHRSEVVGKALTYTKQQLDDIDIVAADQVSIVPDETVTDVVFVLHGIRDKGFWTQKIARRVKLIGDSIPGRKFAIETASYGYFPMLHFLSYMARREKVEWLMDHYVENRMIYPNATFSFIGHSNGTYLLAKAMEKYQACKFKNIILAGSVVHRKYDWEKLIVDKRIAAISNVVSNNDLVVGIFPKTFQTMGWQDLGSGGYDGFKNIDEKAQIKYLRGGHGAAIKELFWNELAHFVIHGKFSQGSIFLPATGRARFIKIMAFIGPLIFFSLIIAVLVGGYLIWTHFTNPMLALFFSFLYILLIFKLLTWY